MASAERSGCPWTSEGGQARASLQVEPRTASPAGPQVADMAELPLDST